MLKGLRLFGKCYSGLEYDYRGLCHVYEKLNLPVEYTRFEQTLETWRVLRNEGVDLNVSYFKLSYYYLIIFVGDCNVCFNFFFFNIVTKNFYKYCQISFSLVTEP